VALRTRQARTVRVPFHHQSSWSPSPVRGQKVMRCPLVDLTRTSGSAWPTPAWISLPAPWVDQLACPVGGSSRPPGRTCHRRGRRSIGTGLVAARIQQTLASSRLAGCARRAEMANWPPRDHVPWAGPLGHQASSGCPSSPGATSRHAKPSRHGPRKRARQLGAGFRRNAGWTPMTDKFWRPRPTASRAFPFGPRGALGRPWWPE
jgi:hypothetical protein